MRRTGLEDFGDPPIEPALSILVNSLELEAGTITKEAPNTNRIEWFDGTLTLRQRLSRLVRSALSFSKNLVNQIGGAIRYFICQHRDSGDTLHGPIHSARTGVTILSKRIGSNIGSTRPSFPSLSPGASQLQTAERRLHSAQISFPTHRSMVDLP
jgi:insertion element IS1 protein InsB